MDIQLQIRQNAMEMQEYMKDLFDWQRSIKKKERAMVATNAANKGQQGQGAGGAPVPRGRASGSVAQAPAELMQPALGPKGPASAAAILPPSPTPSAPSRQNSSQQDAVAKTAAAHTYSSYNKWDKFDVDAALASDDEDQPSLQHQQQRAAGGNGRPAAGGSTATAARDGGVVPPYSAGGAGAAPDPTVLRPPSVAITPQAQAQASTEAQDLLRPVATTRLSQPPASAAPAAAAAAPAASAAGSAAAAAAEPPLPPIRNSEPATADAWRTRGNELFKAGQHDSAYECYSRSVELQPTCLGHANRAMALLKLGRWQDAVVDCSAALSLDPSYVKAYQRRAAAHRALGSGLESARDWEAALRLEPENRATAADRDAALDALMAERKLAPPTRRAAVPVTAPAAPPAPTVSTEAAAASAAGAASAGAGVGAGATSGTGRSEAAAVGLAAAAAALDQVPSETAPMPAADGLSPPQPDAQQVAAPTPAADAPAAPPAAAQQPPRPAAAAATAAAAAAARAAASQSRQPTAPPRNSVEFEAAWRGLGGDPARQAAYLAAIPPASLPAIFKSSLTAPVLAAMVRCVLAGMRPASAPEGNGGAAAAAAGSLSPGQGVAFLSGLMGVARFDMMAMSVPGRERAELRADWEATEAALRSSGGNGGAEAAEQLAALRPKFRL